MRPDPKRLFRGFGKFVAVAVVAALVGAGIGVGLATLTGGDDSPTASTPTTAVAPAPATQTTTTVRPTAPPPPAQTQTQTTATPARLVGPVPKVTIASATIGAPSAATGHARVTVKVTVTNRFSAPLPLEAPAIVSDADEVPLDAAAKSAAGSLIGTLDPDASATGELRFTLPTAVTQRLVAAPVAKLRIAGRSVVLKLTPSG